MNYFDEARKKYKEILEQKDHINEILEDGSKKAKKIASKTLEQAKAKIGY